MDNEGLLDLASEAIEKVAHIATSLIDGRKDRQLLGELGAELFMASVHLRDTGLGRQRNSRLVQKLLKDVERICSPEPSGDGYLCLISITESLPGTPSYERAKQKISGELLEITRERNSERARKAIRHLRKFTKAITKPVTEDPGAVPISTPMEYPSEVKILAYNILRAHMDCTCNLEMPEPSVGKRHSVRLLLQAVPLENKFGHLELDMLFSSAPLDRQSKSGHWQDVQLLIEKIWKPTNKALQKRVGFKSCHVNSLGAPVKRDTKEINKTSGFCDLICTQYGSRICLTIRDDKLHQFLDCEPLKQIVDHTQGISLATILQNYDLSPKMKACLAYILVQSVWQFYDSDWMKTSWTSKTIQFMWDLSSGQQGEAPKLFPAKPYLSVRFGDEDQDAHESTRRIHEVHKYPRARALGIMLVEIGMGSPVPESESHCKDVLQANNAWSWAWRKSEDKKAWPEFDYPMYREAVKNCLKPGIFSEAPFNPDADEKEMSAGLKKRRKILFEKVVFPLEKFLDGTGWKEVLAKIEPLESRTKPLEMSVTDASLHMASTTPLKKLVPDTPPALTGSTLFQGPTEGHNTLAGVHVTGGILMINYNQ